jgi:hypothetical protein
MSATILGWWRPAHGCDHDACDFTELDVAVWLTNQDGPADRLRRLAEALLVDCVDEEAGGNQSIQGLEGSLQQRDAVGPVLVPHAAIPAVLPAGESNPFTLKLALDVWGDDLVGLEAGW